MAAAAYTNFAAVTASPGSNVTVRRTSAIFVAQTGIVAVGGQNTAISYPTGVTPNTGGICNFGTVQAGALLPIEIEVIGTATTAGLILLY
jgi:hypothetical protein